MTLPRACIFKDDVFDPSCIFEPRLQEDIILKNASNCILTYPTICPTIRVHLSHEAENSSWAGRARELLLDIHARVIIAKEQGATALSKGQLQYWSGKYDDLMQEGLCQHPVEEKPKGKRGVVKKTKTQNMLERSIHYKDEVLAFARNFLIPFSSNIAEQAIRMMKVKQKISGCFRSEQGARDFADIRSYISTMKKQGFPILQALAAAFHSKPFYSSA